MPSNVASSLALSPNPSQGEVLVISLTSEPLSQKLSGAAMLSLKYIPDRHILKSECFNSWIAQEVSQNPDSWEKFIANVTHIFYDTLLPLHLEVLLTLENKNKITKKIELLRQQPGYKLSNAVKDFLKTQ